VGVFGIYYAPPATPKENAARLFRYSATHDGPAGDLQAFGRDEEEDGRRRRRRGRGRRGKGGRESSDDDEEEVVEEEDEDAPGNGKTIDNNNSLTPFVQFFCSSKTIRNLHVSETNWSCVSSIVLR